MQFMEIIKAIIPLLVIAGLLYGALFVIKKYGITIRKNKFGSVSINVISSQMIMPKKFISVVKVEDKLLVLGVSDHSITLLKELDDYVIPIEQTDANGVKSNFLHILKKNLGIG